MTETENHNVIITIDRLSFSGLKEILNDENEMSIYCKKLLWYINKNNVLDTNQTYKLSIKIEEEPRIEEKNEND